MTCASPRWENREGGWVRDLTEEGIEPHPGPGIVCQNVDGLSSRLRNCLSSIIRIHQKSPIFAACIQEHHLTRAKIDELDAVNEAFRLGVLLIINPMPDGEYKGGTAIAIPLDSIERKAKETRDPAVKRIRQSVYRSRDGRLTTADILLNETTVKVACAYAPMDGTRPALQSNFEFSRASKSELGPSTSADGCDL